MATAPKNKLGNVAPPPVEDNIGEEPVYDMAQPEDVPAASEETREETKDEAAAARAAASMTERDRYLADVARIRAQRRSFGVQTQKLALPHRPGYKRYWFKDAPGRIETAQDNGWSHILDKDKKNLSRVSGRGQDGQAERLYAMEIPEVFWEEDQARVHKAAQAPIDAIKARPVQAKPGSMDKSDAGKFYSPDEGGILQISETVRRG